MSIEETYSIAMHEKATAQKRATKEYPVLLSHHCTTQCRTCSSIYIMCSTPGFGGPWNTDGGFAKQFKVSDAIRWWSGPLVASDGTFLAKPTLMF